MQSPEIRVRRVDRILRKKRDATLYKREKKGTSGFALSAAAQTLPEKSLGEKREYQDVAEKSRG